MSKSKGQSGAINITGKSVQIHGDIVGHDKIVTNNIPDERFTESMLNWQNRMESEIAKVNLSVRQIDEIKSQIETIKSVIVQEKGKNPTRLENLFETLAMMSPEIFDVAITTVANPLAGIGLVLRKISDRAKLERLP